MTGTRMLRKGLLRRDLCSPHQIEAEPNGGGGTALVTSLPSHTLTFADALHATDVATIETYLQDTYIGP